MPPSANPPFCVCVIHVYSIFCELNALFFLSSFFPSLLLNAPSKITPKPLTLILQLIVQIVIDLRVNIVNVLRGHLLPHKSVRDIVIRRVNFNLVLQYIVLKQKNLRKNRALPNTLPISRKNLPKSPKYADSRSSAPPAYSCSSSSGSDFSRSSTFAFPSRSRCYRSKRCRWTCAPSPFSTASADSWPPSWSSPETGSPIFWSNFVRTKSASG